MTLQTVELTPKTGTEIKIDRDELLTGKHREKIRELLDQRGVLLFRELNLTDDEQLEFTKTLGTLLPQGENGIYEVTRDPKRNSLAYLFLATFLWHMDGAEIEFPRRASLLTARAVAAVGGQTEFANMYAAYDSLPENEKRAYEKLRVVHSQVAIQRKFFPNPTEAQLQQWREQEVPRSQPLVWTHQSGRKSFVLGMSASHIEGMDSEESRILLDQLHNWATQPRFVYRHHWSIGDLIIWDNTGMLHRVEPYAEDSGRLLTRTSLVAEEALG